MYVVPIRIRRHRDYLIYMDDYDQLIMGRDTPYNYNHMYIY